MMLPSRLGCPLSLKTPNMGITGYKSHICRNGLSRVFGHIGNLDDSNRRQ